MMTPQEVSSHSFSKATLGGYNMAMVDEFLDQLTEDYTNLFNDNAILKNKLKVLSDTVEEYRATDAAMRKTLLAAQQMAESIVQDAEKKKATLMETAEETAQKRVEQLRREIAAEEGKLRHAREATAEYAAKVGKLFEAQELMLRELYKLAPPPTPAEQPDRMDETVQDIEENLSHILAREAKAADPIGETVQKEPAHIGANRIAADPELAEATRRFENIQFGKDYEIM